jgi:TolB-like protein
MKKVLRKFSGGALTLVFVIVVLAPAIWAEEPVKVAILPFAMNADKDLSYLRDGIVDMLASRIYYEGKVTVVEKGRVKRAMEGHTGALNLQSASAIGRELGADYVLFGSLTIFGESVSMDATMANLSKEEPPVTVFTQTQGMETVVPEINRFAQKVNAKIFGRPYPEEAPAYGPAAAAPRAAADTGASPLNPQFRKYSQVDEQTGGFWKSRRIKSEVRGLDIGDVTGDGRNELVLVEDTEIHVYRLDQGALKRVAMAKSDDNYRFLSVDVADINKNGRAEIFASKFNEDMTSFTSLVFELKGDQLVTLVKESPWFYRVMTWPGKGTILVGQQKGRPGDVGGELGSVIRDLFERRLYQLTWNGSAYVPAAGEPLLDLSGPGFSSVYIYNFAIGDVSGDGIPEIVMTDASDHLRLMDLQGEQLQKTSEYYGGTLNFITTNPHWDDSKSRSVARTVLFIPARPLIADLDGNGKNEIIVNQNKSTTYGLAQRLRAFSDGRVVSLSWNGIGLEPVWESRQLNGCLSDFKIKDLDNDGKPDLVVAMLQERGGSLFKDAKSLVVSYTLNLEKGAGAAPAGRRP